MIFRLGDRKYKVNREWATVPEHFSLNNVTSIKVNSVGEIVVLQRSQPFVFIFSGEGELIDTWNDDSIIDGHMLYITPYDDIIIVDRDYHRLAFFDRGGKFKGFVGEKDYPGAPGIPFNHPTDVVTTGDGNAFVTDGYGNSCIHHFDQNWNLIRTWGKKGTNKGDFSTPHAIVANESNQLFVTDRENNRVQVFNTGGNFLRTINDLYHPMDICIDTDGLIYVTDQTPSINLFDGEGVFRGRCRTFGVYGHGITVDKHGSIYVAEMIPDGITKLERICE